LSSNNGKGCVARNAQKHIEINEKYTLFGTILP